MKKMFFLIALFSILTINLFSQDISGRYYLNTNQYTGYIDISQNGNNITGTMSWSKDNNGDAINDSAKFNGTATKADGTIYIKFLREGNPQTYHGWFSKDYKLVAGFFEKNYKSPWYATKN